MSENIRIILNGAGGRMGREISRILESGSTPCSLAAAVDAKGLDAVPYPAYTSMSDCDIDADCIIDFSNHAATSALLTYAKEKKLPVVLKILFIQISKRSAAYHIRTNKRMTQKSLQKRRGHN